MKMRHLLLALSLATIPAFTVAAEKPDRSANSTAPAAAPAAAPANNAAIMAEKARADKKAMVATNMALTDSEAQAFWPLYDEYQKGVEALNARHVKAVSDFFDAQKKGQSADDAGRKLVDEMLAVEQAEADLRKTMAPKLLKALPAVKVARYLQIEGKVRAVQRGQLAQRLPLVGGQPKPNAAQGQQPPRQPRVKP